MEDIVETLKNKNADLSKEDLRQINNKLIDISVYTHQINLIRKNIDKKIIEIKKIIK